VVRLVGNHEIIHNTQKNIEMLAVVKSGFLQKCHSSSFTKYKWVLEAYNHSATLEFTELFRTTHFFHKYLVRCFILYTCSNGLDWNTWIQ